MCGVGSQGQTKHTHLGPHDLRQCGDELRRRVEVLGDDLLIDHLADGVPQRLRECLCHLRVRSRLPRTEGGLVLGIAPLGGHSFLRRPWRICLVVLTSGEL